MTNSNPNQSPVTDGITLKSHSLLKKTAFLFMSIAMTPICYPILIVISPYLIHEAWQKKKKTQRLYKAKFLSLKAMGFFVSEFITYIFYGPFFAFGLLFTATGNPHSKTSAEHLMDEYHKLIETNLLPHAKELVSAVDKNLPRDLVRSKLALQSEIDKFWTQFSLDTLGTQKEKTPINQSDLSYTVIKNLSFSIRQWRELEMDRHIKNFMKECMEHRHELPTVGDLSDLQNSIATVLAQPQLFNHLTTIANNPESCLDLNLYPKKIINLLIIAAIQEIDKGRESAVLKRKIGDAADKISNQHVFFGRDGQLKPQKVLTGKEALREYTNGK
ncbi:MAG: hypothetical protein V4490_06025 [Pseudomonadota bacterium]